MSKEVVIDGSMGEGGGQILRSSLALSLITGRPFRVTNIRAGRKKTGLLRQHLTAVNAATQVSGAEVQGDEIGSPELTFRPGRVRPGSYHFSVGTAGSATLVLQTVLLALMIAPGPTELVLEGGTHNPYAPPFDYLEKAFLPCIRRMGPQVFCSLERAGFYPAGGGRFRVSIGPVPKLSPLELCDRGDFISHRARAFICQLSPRIARRELQVLKQMLNWEEESLEVVEVRESNGPGNVLVVELHFTNISEVVTGFGERGVSAETVADRTAQEVHSYLVSGVPVGTYMADQLLLPLSIAGSGVFRTMPPTQHTLTNIEVIRRFLDLDIRCEEVADRAWQITVGAR